MSKLIMPKCRAVAGMMVGLVAMAACGGGGGDQLAGIDRLGVSSGSVSGFGSVFVNGVEYETDTAAFDIDDAAGSEGDLDVGDVVTIEWTSNDGVTFTADRVTYDDTLEGPIAALDVAAGLLVVLGQTVVVDAGTSFDEGIVPASLDGLAVGQFVEVSGFVGGDGSIVASRLERVLAGADDLEVHGVIQSLDSLNETFVINGLTVDYSRVVELPVLANGDLIEARGGALGTNGELLATELTVDQEGLQGATEGDEAEIEGFVTRFASATDFDVAGVRVTTSAATEYEGGGVADLALNVKVEVEGEVNASVTVVATKIHFRDVGDGTGDVEIAAAVDAVDPAAGTLVVLGITVRVDALTRIEDQSDAQVRPFGLTDIRTGDAVEVRGTAQDDGSVRATLLEREDQLERDILRGAVESVSGQSLVILGVTVDTDGNTVYRSNDDSLIPAATFFAAIGAGTEVQASGAETGPFSMLAEELQLED